MTRPETLDRINAVSDLLSPGFIEGDWKNPILRLISSLGHQGTAGIGDEQWLCDYISRWLECLRADYGSLCRRFGK